MIGGIFGVLGQAQQQAEAQKQKNLDAQNEMNRVMMMAGYRPDATDPAATQGGAPPQGIADILGQTYGTSDYEFDPSQYAFDPNSPQGQRLALDQRRVALEETIAENEKTHQDKVFDHNKSQDAWQQTHVYRKYSDERADKLRQMSYKDRLLAFDRDKLSVERDLRQQGINIAHMNATANGYKFINKGGQFVTIDIFNKDENGQPTMTVEELPPTATTQQRNALQQVVTLADLKSTKEFWDELDPKQQGQFNVLLATAMDFIAGNVVDWEDDGEGKGDGKPKGESGSSETPSDEVEPWVELDPLLTDPVDHPQQNTIGNSKDEAESLMEEVETARLSGTPMSLTEEQRMLLDRYGEEHNLGAWFKDFIQRGVQGDKSYIGGK